MQFSVRSTCCPHHVRINSDVLKKQVSQVLPSTFCYTIVGSVLADRQRHVETEYYSVNLDIRVYQAHRVTKVSSVANE